MTLNEYQKKVCSIVKQPVYWGSLTVDLCTHVCAISGTWSDMLNCQHATTDKLYKRLERKWFVDIGNVFVCLALLAREAGTTLGHIHKYAHHEGMGDGSVAKYIFRLVGSSGEFLCPRMDRVDSDHKKIIVDNIVLIMHDIINVIEAYKPSVRGSKDVGSLMNDILELSLTSLRNSKEGIT